MTRQPRWLAVMLFGLAAAGCSLNPEVRSNRQGLDSGSYVVHGQRYYILRSSAGFVQRGIASWYGPKFHGKRTSSGERYDMYAMTAAHKRLPIPSRVEVINLANGHRAVVRVNDRGPFAGNRIIDVSYAAAKKLGMLGTGTAPVEIRAIPPEGKSVNSPPAATLAGAPSTHDSSGYYVQVGAFTQRTNAYRLQDELQAGKFATPVRVDSVDEGGNTFYRVRLGPLQSREAAGRLTRNLADYGLSDARTIDPP